MATAILNAMENGLTVSRETLDEAGIRPGDQVVVTVSPVPSARTIQMRALRYCAAQLGDAVGVGEPKALGDEWIVSLATRDGIDLGVLVFSLAGEVVPEHSTTLKSALEKMRAARAIDQAA